MKKSKVLTLNLRQKLFCEEYIIDYNATQATIRAGYSSKGAAVAGGKLLKREDVQEYIAELREETQKRNQITLDECIGLLTDIATADIADMYNDDGSMKPIKDIPKATRMAVGAIDTEELFIGRGDNRTKIGTIKKGKIIDRTAAIRDLIKHFGGFREHNEQSKTEVNVFQDIDLSSLTNEELTVFKKILEKNPKANQ